MSDLIDRQKAINAVNTALFPMILTAKDAEKALRKLPSAYERDKAEAQPQRVRGRWKRTYLDHEAMGERPSVFYCSGCSQCIAYPTNYCPSCGSYNGGSQDG